MRSLPLLLGMLACRHEADPDPIRFEPLPEPDDWVIAGPGGPSAAQDALDQPCAYLLGGPEDVQHHNLVSIHDGWLVLPWSPEEGSGGLSLFAFDDPCSPEKVGEGWTPFMRESHTLAFAEVDGRDFVAVDYHEETAAGPIGGVGFWEITDPTAPVWVSQLALPDYFYPDAYLRVTLSTFWQGDLVFVSGAGNGVYVVDASDPLNPAHVGTITLDTPHLVGTFHVIGNLAMSSSAGLSRTVLMDVSDPLAATPLPGGDFHVLDAEGEQLPYYFSNVGGRYGLFARKSSGGGPVAVDLTDPTAPVQVGAVHTPDGDGGYVFRHGDRLFLGDSNFASIYDFTDPAAMVELSRVQLTGDFDTLTPIGNVAVGSVDSGAADGQATAVYPWAAEPDAIGPTAELVSPADGALRQALTSRIGASFDEQIEAKSVHAGSFRVWDERGAAVPGRFQAQENLVNFTPDAPLEPDTTYVIVLPAGGVADVSGNPTPTELRWRFSTGDTLEALTP